MWYGKFSAAFQLMLTSSPSGKRPTFSPAPEGYNLSHDRQRNFFRRNRANVESNRGANFCEPFLVRSAFAQTLQHNICSAFAAD